MSKSDANADGRYVMLLSVHGLVRGFDLELGRDADTGGQVKYVVELARALAQRDDVSRVDLVTRLIRDERVDDSYAAPVEPLGPKARIVRVECGPPEYLPKERLWPHLEGMVDRLLQRLRAQGRAPDIVHGHYADAGYLAAQLSGVLNVPMVFTGHSLGRVKRQRLKEGGLKEETIERRYKIRERIEAEETALDHAAFVVASTHQEVEEQYKLYDNYQPDRMHVIPPGVDLSRFSPPRRGDDPARIDREIAKFLNQPRKPIILAISRADPRKNIETLLHAYGRNAALQEAANLVIVAGNRDDIREMDKGAREVLTNILLLIDRYELYGKVAYPKHHDPDDVPDLYRLAARTGGVFVNPALTEPFGLTLLEAAACGLPIVATEDGGPRDILEACRSGVLIDPLDAEAMGAALLRAVTDREQWRQWSRNGLRGAHRHFSWQTHAERYMRQVRGVLTRHESRPTTFSVKRRLISADRLIVSDIDDTLLGNQHALDELIQMLQAPECEVAFGVATGRNLPLTLQALDASRMPTPTVLITSVGSEIYYGPRMIEDRGWRDHISYRWRPDALRAAMAEIPGVELQPPEHQGRFKISYFVNPDEMPTREQIVRHLRRKRVTARVIYSHAAFLDILPVRASKGTALRYFAWKWGIPLDRCLAAGASASDEDMLTGETFAVVVAGHDPTLDKLRGHPRIYFSEGGHAYGIIEAIGHYDFLGEPRAPEEPAPEPEPELVGSR